MHPGRWSAGWGGSCSCQRGMMTFQQSSSVGACTASCPLVWLFNFHPFPLSNGWEARGGQKWPGFICSDQGFVVGVCVLASHCQCLRRWYKQCTWAFIFEGQWFRVALWPEGLPSVQSELIVVFCGTKCRNASLVLTLERMRLMVEGLLSVCVWFVKGLWCIRGRAHQYM